LSGSHALGQDLLGVVSELLGLGQLVQRRQNLGVAFGAGAQALFLAELE
jgi:hypothetical protein